MKRETVDYFRMRERAERQAVANSACEEARRVHQQLADAYARLVELEDLKAAGAIAPGKVTSVSEALRSRADPVYGRRLQRSRAPVSPLLRIF